MWMFLVADEEDCNDLLKVSIVALYLEQLSQLIALSDKEGVMIINSNFDSNS